MKQIILTQSKFAIVDDEDYKLLNSYKWCAKLCDGKWYALRGTWINNKRGGIYMHRQIMQFPNKKQIDHKNGNGLDNRRENLRIANQTQNNANQSRKNKNLAGFKGVQYKKERNKYVASIGFHRAVLYLGIFDQAEEAARVYDKKAKELFGEFARLNFSAQEGKSRDENN